MSTPEFDPKGMYAEVVGAVKTAVGSAGSGEEGRGEMRVYRVKHEGSRVEYYLVALDAAKKRVVGVRARAVES